MSRGLSQFIKDGLVLVGGPPRCDRCAGPDVDMRPHREAKHSRGRNRQRRGDLPRPPVPPDVRQPHRQVEEDRSVDEDEPECDAQSAALDELAVEKELGQRSAVKGARGDGDFTGASGDHHRNPVGGCPSHICVLAAGNWGETMKRDIATLDWRASCRRRSRRSRGRRPPKAQLRLCAARPARGRDGLYQVKSLRERAARARAQTPTPLGQGRGV